MNMGYTYLLDVLARSKSNIGELASKIGITPQAIDGWKESIPPKRVQQIRELFDLNGRDVDLLLGNEPLHFEFRNKSGIEIDESGVPELVKIRMEAIFERFFSEALNPSAVNLSNLSNKISECGEDFIRIAQIIRDEFEIPSYAPVTHESSNMILDRIGVRALFLPFRAIKLGSNGEPEQTAILFKKENRNAILIDSDRSIDEAHFDKLHELLHILFGHHVGKQTSSTEALLDRVCGELIYPKSFIIDKYFGGNPDSKPIKDKERLWIQFISLNRKWRMIHSPKGLARAMKDAGLASATSELFRYLFKDLHDLHRLATADYNYSKMGKMDFDFSNRDKLWSFYQDSVNNPTGTVEYPLFEKLRTDVLSGKLSPADFGDTFGLSHADAFVIASMWENSKHAPGK